MKPLSISKHDAVLTMRRLGAPPDIEDYELHLAVDGGEAVERIDFEDGTTVFLHESSRQTYGTFKYGWDVGTHRAAYVLIQEDRP